MLFMMFELKLQIVCFRKQLSSPGTRGGGSSKGVSVRLGAAADSCEGSRRPRRDGRHEAATEEDGGKNRCSSREEILLDDHSPCQ